RAAFVLAQVVSPGSAFQESRSRLQPATQEPCRRYAARVLNMTRCPGVCTPGSSPKSPLRGSVEANLGGSFRRLVFIRAVTQATARTAQKAGPSARTKVLGRDD